MKKRFSVPVRGIIFLMLFTVLGCSAEDAAPEYLIDEDTYVNLVVEFKLLDSYQQSLPPDSSIADSLTDLILDKYEVSEEQYIKSRNYYHENPKLYSELIEKAIEELKMDRIKKDTVENSPGEN